MEGVKINNRRPIRIEGHCCSWFFYKAAGLINQCFFIFLLFVVPGPGIN